MIWLVEMCDDITQWNMHPMGAFTDPAEAMIFVEEVCDHVVFADWNVSVVDGTFSCRYDRHGMVTVRPMPLDPKQDWRG